MVAGNAELEKVTLNARRVMIVGRADRRRRRRGRGADPGAATDHRVDVHAR
jgi:hypothetical protein